MLIGSEIESARCNDGPMPSHLAAYRINIRSDNLFINGGSFFYRGIIYNKITKIYAVAAHFYCKNRIGDAIFSECHRSLPRHFGATDSIVVVGGILPDGNVVDNFVKLSTRFDAAMIIDKLLNVVMILP